MSSSDFRLIAARGDRPGSDRLFRAAITAFCALTRPSRAEATQIDDLALPLFDDVSTETLRFAAAALSDMRPAPTGLIRRLCDQPVETAAPLLTRSPALSDIDLIALIGRNGLSHARAIAHRPELNPNITNLIRALEGTIPDLKEAPASVPDTVSVTPEPEGQKNVIATDDSAPSKSKSAEETRNRLRGMMRPSRKAEPDVAITRIDTGWRDAAGCYDKLRSTALTGVAAFFETALADSLGIAFSKAHAIVRSRDYADLSTALRALDIDAAQAFVLASACFTGRFTHPEAIRQFHDGFEGLHPQAARERVDRWRMDFAGDEIRQAVLEKPVLMAANSAGPEPKAQLKAS